MRSGDVTVVVPTFHSEGIIGECLRSIPAHLPVIVVDNGSRDRTLVETRDARPDVRIVSLNQNMGFGYACNRGIEASLTPFVLLLNPDASLPLESYKLIADTLNQHHDVHILGAVQNSQRRKLGAHEFGDVQVVSGACMAIRTAAFEDAVFDEAIFLYGEDGELCERVIRQGGRVVAHKGIALDHKRKSSSQTISVPKLLRHRLIGQSQGYRLKKAHPYSWPFWVVGRSIELMGTLLAQPLKLRTESSQRKLAILGGLWSFVRHGQKSLWDNPLAQGDVSKKALQT